MKMKTLFSIACALALITPAFAQDYTAVSLPFATLAGTGSGGSAGITTNLASGWQTVTSFTNIQNLWNSSSNAFVLTTNVVSMTNTTYADFSAKGQNYVPLFIKFNAAAGTSNVVFTIARTHDGSTFLTTGNTLWTNVATTTTDVVAANQLDMRGYIGGRITSVTWGGTTGDILTNKGCWKSNKPN